MVRHSLPVDTLIQTWTIHVCVSDSSVGLLAVCNMVYAWCSGPCLRITLALPILGTIRVSGIDSQWSMAMADVHIQV